MRKPGGYAVLVGPAIDQERSEAFQGQGEVAECDTFSCGHCGFIVHVPLRAAPENLGGLCKTCMKLICPNCVNKGICTPLEKRIEMMEARGIARRSYGL